MAVSILVISLSTLRFQTVLLRDTMSNPCPYDLISDLEDNQLRKAEEIRDITTIVLNQLQSIIQPLTIHRAQLGAKVHESVREGLRTSFIDLLG